MSELFYLGKTDNFTVNSFRLTIDRGLSSIASIVQERFYLCATPYISSVEPVRTPDLIVNSGFVQGVSTLTFGDLPAHQNYWIYAWREYSSASGLGTVKSTQGIFGVSPNMDFAPGLTLIDTVTVDPTIQQITLNLQDLADFDTEWVGRHSQYSVSTDVANMGGDVVKLDINPSDKFGGWLVSKKRWNKDKPINVKFSLRVTPDSNGKIPWGCVDLFADNTDDCGITWRQSSDANNGYLCATRNIPWVDSTPARKVTYYREYEIDYNPDVINAGDTAHPKGLVILRARTDLTGSWVEINRFTWHFTVDPFIILVGNYEGTTDGLSSSIEWGNIRVTGEEVFASTGYTFRFPKPVNCSSTYGPESGGGYPNDNSYHFYEQGGGVTIGGGSNAAVNFNGFDLAPAGGSYPSGSFSFATPKIFAVSGYKYDKARLVGSVRSGGSLVSKFYRAGFLIPDSEISGNSTGFTPSFKSELVVDLSNVTAGPIRVKTTGYNPTAGVNETNAYTDYELVDDGDGGSYQSYIGPVDSGPPILKAVSVSFTTGTLGLLEEPVTLLFSTQPFTQSITSDGGAVGYGTTELLTGFVSELQNIQSESASAFSGFIGSVSESQNKQTSLANALEIFQSSVAQAQTKQTESVSSLLTFAGSVNESQLKQQESSSLALFFSGTIAELQALQAEALTGTITTQGVFVGSVNQLQNIQAESVLSAESFEAFISEVQLSQSEAVAVIQAFQGVAQSQKVQSEAGTGQLLFVGIVSQSQRLQSEFALDITPVIVKNASTVYASQIESAKRQIKAKGASVVWRSPHAVVDESKPWKVTASANVDNQVSIVFDIVTGSNKSSRYLKDTNVEIGTEIGYMASVEFEPKLGDVVIRNGKELSVKNINTIQPDGNPILHIIEFAK